MLRRTLLAALLCLSAWALADRTVTASTAASILAAPAASTATHLSTLPSDTGSSDLKWEAPQPSSISVRGASWRAQFQHVEVPGVSIRDLNRATHRRDAFCAPSPLRPPHLHDTPLLI